MSSKFYLSTFKEHQPQNFYFQKNILEWLLSAHKKSDREHLQTSYIEKAIPRFGCSAERINTRASYLKDFSHSNWLEMEIYNLEHSPQGYTMKNRMDAYQKYTKIIFDELYKNEINPPDHLLHVSCTGYVAPSAAQLLVSKNNWGQKTTLTHLYHMGCYAAIPAIRVACGMLPDTINKKMVQIAHTELCSLHLNPSMHEPEQIVAQSLFADGAIRYEVQNHDFNANFEILSSMEWVLSNTETEMSWNISDWGMKMTLSRYVPKKISENILGFIETLLKKSPTTLKYNNPEILYAIHPGGPKIIDNIQTLLGLNLSQVEHSKKILFERGNMSSATLPHLWNLISNDKQIKSGTPILSLAFGPGLTMCGLLLIKT